jgi:hypothetical protein
MLVERRHSCLRFFSALSPGRDHKSVCLQADFNHLTWLNGLKRDQGFGDLLFKIADVVGAGTDNHDGNAAASHVLLVADIFVDGDEWPTATLHLFDAVNNGSKYLWSAALLPALLFVRYIQSKRTPARTVLIRYWVCGYDSDSSATF